MLDEQLQNTNKTLAAWNLRGAYMSLQRQYCCQSRHVGTGRDVCFFFIFFYLYISILEMGRADGMFFLFYLYFLSIIIFCFISYFFLFILLSFYLYFFYFFLVSLLFLFTFYFFYFHIFYIFFRFNIFSSLIFVCSR
jgi:hypothetical protein